MKLVFKVGRRNLTHRRAAPGTFIIAGFILVLTATAVRAQVVETIIYNFHGPKDGSGPQSVPLLEHGENGKVVALVGTTYGGYNQVECFNNVGCGSIYRLMPPTGKSHAWKETTIWGFSGGSDGGTPNDIAALVKHPKLGTTLYGTTLVGGTHGDGVVFKITGSKLTPVYAFTGGDDGANPDATVGDGKGGLYVSAQDGGPQGCGAIIDLSPSGQAGSTWAESTIWTFTGGRDGCNPNGVFVDSTGVLFGTAQYGAANGAGTVFKLTPPAQGKSVWTEQTLLTFNGTNGYWPRVPLTAGKGGVLYGSTNMGGANPCSNGFGCGTIFEVKPAKSGGTPTVKTIWNFTGDDGANPVTTLLVDANGVLFGTTQEEGGTGKHGVAFRLSPPAKGQSLWTETVLLAFDGPNGAAPGAGLSDDGTGVLYGAAFEGGTHSEGLVYTLTGTGLVP